MALKLRIVTPEGVAFDGEVESVSVPGESGAFEVLQGHAPLISSLVPGRVSYKSASGAGGIDISGGFAEVRKNEVSVCAEPKA